MAGLNITVPTAAGSYLYQIDASSDAALYAGADYTIEGLYSPGRTFRLIGQNDGNFVLQCVNDGDLRQDWQHKKLDPSEVDWVTYWATNTAWNQVGDVGPVANNVLVMQLDGNLVVYDYNKAQGFVPGGAVWASNTEGKGGVCLRLQDDGNLIIPDRDNRAIWATNTSAAETPGANV